MNRSEVLSFVESFLDHRGARLVKRGAGVLEVAPLEADADGLALPRLLAFGPNAHRRNPEAELVAVGSAFLDRLVGEAVRGGRLAVVYEPTPQQAPMPRIPDLPQVVGGSWGRPRAGYRPVFLFVYVAEFRTIDVPDDLVMIGLDPARGEAVPDVRPLLAAMSSCATEPEPGWEEPGVLPSRGTLLRSLGMVDRRLQRRARTFKEAATIEIARETANIEAYYRRLIDEVRHPVGRGRMSPEDEARRVRALQLDWKRRVQEVARFWEAGVFVRLSALGVVMTPSWILPFRGAGGGRRGQAAGRAYLAADPRTGRLWEPLCPLCGARLRGRLAAVGADLVCAGHEQEQEPENQGVWRGTA